MNNIMHDTRFIRCPECGVALQVPRDEAQIYEDSYGFERKGKSLTQWEVYNTGPYRVDYRSDMWRYRHGF